MYNYNFSSCIISELQLANIFFGMVYKAANGDTFGFVSAEGSIWITIRRENYRVLEHIVSPSLLHKLHLSKSGLF